MAENGRPFCGNRNSCDDAGYAHRCYLGKGCLGTVLVVGCERDLVSGNMAVISFLPTRPKREENCLPLGSRTIDARTLLPADVLVGCELPSLSSGVTACV